MIDKDLDQYRTRDARSAKLEGRHMNRARDFRCLGSTVAEDSNEELEVTRRM